MPQVFTVATPVCVAVQVNHTSDRMAVPAPTRLQSASAWPSAPVVAVVLSKGKVPVPTITNGVAQESDPTSALDSALAVARAGAPAATPGAGRG